MPVSEPIIDAINEALSSKPSDLELARKFITASEKIKRYVVGQNEQSIELIEQYMIHGLIDDFSPGTGHWHGVPILASQEVSANSIVANCSTSISPVNVARKLRSMGIQHIVSFGDLLKVAPDRLNQPWFVAQQRDDIAYHLQEWMELHDSLADTESRLTLLDVIRFRLSADPRYMESYAVRFKDQYFEAFLDTSRQVFVDVGGFDGDTTEEFCKRYPDYRKVFLFEPSAFNMEAARKRLAQTRDIKFHEIGISDSEGTLPFNAYAGSASSVNKDKCQNISVTTLDHAIHEPVTFIKMDIEGWEIKALHGAKRLIVEHTPQLAIAVYHHASDFREIANFVLSLNPSYQLYLRHYTQGWSETVMFFTRPPMHG